MGSILTLDELFKGENAIVCFCQQQRFKEEISTLSSKNATVSRRSSIYRLDLVLEDGLLKVGRRLSKGLMPEEAKHPLILSKEQHVSMLILKYSMYSRAWVMVVVFTLFCKEEVLDHQ